MTADNQVRLHLLYDFYGQLLTEKQRSFFELYHHVDLSLGEIAEQHGVSRQAVYDILKRAERTLEELESKLQLVERFLRERQVVEELDRELAALQDDIVLVAGGSGGAGTGQDHGPRDELVARIRERVRGIRERLRTLAADEQ
ncbi:MAG TPA: YlxM family DNA-binding protein [Limnochordales bacterium]